MTRWYLTVAEAAALLLLARLLVAGPRLGYWRTWLGPLIERGASTGPATVDYRLAHAVERAARRLPGVYKCLPRALALHWMLRRRQRPSELVIAVLPGPRRGTIDDLHAWVEMTGAVLIGELDLPFRPVGRFGGDRWG